MYTERYKSHHDASRALKKRFTQKIDKAEYVGQKMANPTEESLVVYLHVPFCNKVCSFCPFHRPDKLKRRSYHEYLIEQIERLKDYPYMKSPVRAVNFGGGTPTALLPQQMEIVLAKLNDTFDIRKDAEFSVESSVTELTDEMLEILVKGGVNRLSIGIQSFNDDARKMFGRRGNGEHAAARVKRAIEFGITNTNIDLIYHYPGQTEEMLREDIRIIRSLGLAGLSFYPLMIHEQTPLAGRIDERARNEMADMEQEYHMFELIADELKKDGYDFLELNKLVRNNLDHYEYMSLRHNVGSCIALGEGAGGNIGEYYYKNTLQELNLSDAIPICGKGRIVTSEYRIIDAFIYELQKSRVDLQAYSEKLNMNLEKILAVALEHLEAEGLLYRNGSVIELTTYGKFWGNNIIDEFVQLMLV